MSLNWQNGTAIVPSVDESRFEKELRDALMTSRDVSAGVRTAEEFKSEFLPLVRRWCEAHRELVRGCYVSLAARPLSVFVIGQKSTYDFSLSDPAADLEMELFALNWSVEVLHLPHSTPEALRSLFDVTDSVQVYGDSG